MVQKEAQLWEKICHTLRNYFQEFRYKTAPTLLELLGRPCLRPQPFVVLRGHRGRHLKYQLYTLFPEVWLLSELLLCFSQLHLSLIKLGLFYQLPVALALKSQDLINENGLFLRTDRSGTEMSSDFFYVNQSVRSVLRRVHCWTVPTSFVHPGVSLGKYTWAVSFSLNQPKCHMAFITSRLQRFEKCTSELPF